MPIMAPCSIVAACKLTPWSSVGHEVIQGGQAHLAAFQESGPDADHGAVLDSCSMYADPMSHRHVVADTCA